MPARPKSTMIVLTLALGLLGPLGTDATQAADPLGRYKDAKMDVTYKEAIEILPAAEADQEQLVPIDQGVRRQGREM